MGATLLEAKGLYHAFDYPLYEDISLELREGESIAIMGRSGSGKTTLLHTLAGLITPLRGEVKLFGKDIYKMKESKREHLRRYLTGIVFQSHYLFKGMSARENIEIASILAEKKMPLALLKRLEIDNIIDSKVSQLSGGQQQRVSLARVLAKEPKIIFADEPTGNLDTESASLVIEVLKEYIEQNRASLFMVTHDFNIASHSQRVYQLKDKKLELIK